MILARWLLLMVVALQSTDVAAVRKLVDEARKDVDAYKDAGVAEHPAIKWDQQLWAVHEAAPDSEAGALAAAEAVRLLMRAQMWDRANARIASVRTDDRAWERLPQIIYDAGISRQDLPSVLATLSPVIASTSSAAVKASALIVVGRVQRRQKDLKAAAQALREAMAAAPNTPYAEDAEGLLYEVEHLSPGLPAPPVAGKARNGRPIDLAALRGKPVVLVFWGTT